MGGRGLNLPHSIFKSIISFPYFIQHLNPNVLFHQNRSFSFFPFIHSDAQQLLELMFMKHYAPNRCEPSIKKMRVQWRRGGGGSGFVNEDVKYCTHTPEHMRASIKTSVEMFFGPLIQFYNYGKRGPGTIFVHT